MKCTTDDGSVPTPEPTVTALPEEDEGEAEEPKPLVSPVTK